MEMNRTYLCIDLKSFYASVECVERGLDPFKYNLVVADPSRGNGAICLAVSPALKNKGVKNRCRIFEIPKNIHYITALPRMKLYIKYSADIYEIYLKYVSKDDIHIYSVDECFLDITKYLNMYHMTSFELARMIIKDVYNTTGITATAGIGTNLYLTKVALDITAKHVKDNIGYLDEDKYKEELWHHTPLTDFWQIGRGINKRLSKLGINDMYDIAMSDEFVLYKEFGINAKYLIDHSKGIEPCTIKDIKSYKPKSNSISNTQILFEDYSYKKARTVLIEMIDVLTLQLVSRKKLTDNICFYIGYSKDIIKGLSISKKLEQPTNSYKIIVDIVLKEYDNKVNREYKIRRLGIFYGGLQDKKCKQLDIFNMSEFEDRDERLENTINSIKSRFGKNSILRAVSLKEEATAIKRNKLIGGHNAE